MDSGPRLNRSTSGEAPATEPRKTSRGSRQIQTPRTSQVDSLFAISQSVLAAIRAHGERTYPHECCGVLLGRDAPDGWSIVAAAEARNVCIDSPQTRYEIAPQDLIRIDREATRQRLSIAGFYHSHPDHPAYWSATDLAEAYWPGACYIITAVAQGMATETLCFRLVVPEAADKRFEAETIEIFGIEEPARP